MSIVKKLKDQENFTDAEIVLANYILDNLNKMGQMTIYTLSDNSFCSVATISRFCKKLKLKNFNQLRVQIVAECSPIAINKVEPNQPFSKEDSEETIAETIFNLSIQSLSETLANLNLELIHEAAVLIDQAEHIDIYANWTSSIAALSLHNKLIWMGKDPTYEIVPGFQFAKAIISNEKHLAILVSYYGTSAEAIRIAKALHSSNTPYILLTGPNLNPLCVNAKIVIHVPCKEEYSYKIAPYSTDIALEYTINILYSYLYALHYDENMQKRFSVILHKDDLVTVHQQGKK